MRFTRALQAALILIATLVTVLAACAEDGKGGGPAALFDALLTVDSLPAGWGEAPPIPRAGLGYLLGDDPANPVLCAVRPDSPERINEAQASFQLMSEVGHGPFLYQIVVSLPEGGATTYLAEVRSIIESCPEQIDLPGGDVLRPDGPVPTDPSRPVATWAFSSLALEKLGDESVAFRRALVGGVQPATLDTVYIRRGKVLAIIVRATLGEGDMEEAAAFARQADDALARVAD